MDSMRMISETYTSSTSTTGILKFMYLRHRRLDWVSNLLFWNISALQTYKYTVLKRISETVYQKNIMVCDWFISRQSQQASLHGNKISVFSITVSYREPARWLTVSKLDSWVSSSELCYRRCWDRGWAVPRESVTR